MNSAQKTDKDEPKETQEHAKDIEKTSNLTYIYGFLGAIILFLASLFLVKTHMHYMGWEISLFHGVNNWPAGLEPLFWVATVAPESVLIGLVAVAVSFFLKMYKLAWRLSVLTFGGYAVTFVVKHFFGRPRPQEVLADLHVRASETGSGFSSGHTMMMTVVALAVLPYLPKNIRWIPLVMVAMTALSRIYLGVHAPLDVVGGFAVGLGCVCFLQILPKNVKKLLRLL